MPPNVAGDTLGVMAYPQYGPPADRWRVNLPAVIGVVFVFLVGVVAWVVLSATGDDDSVATSTPSSTTPTSSPGASPTPTTTPPDSTTPAPMPDLTTITPVTSAPATTPPTTPPPTAPPATTAPPANPAPATTAPPTTVPATAAPPTTAPGSPTGTVAGDLGVPGRPMQRPGCDGAFITIIASAVGDQATAVSIGSVLDAYPTSEYLRTDQTCPSLNPSVDGEPIYVVYFGPFLTASDACAARSRGTEGAYAKELTDDKPPSHVVECG